MKKFLVSIFAALMTTGTLAENVRPNARPLRPEDTMTYGEVGNAYRLNPDRTIHLVGIVGFNALSAAGSVVGMLGKAREPVALVINSPGGSVLAGEMLMSSLQMARSTGIRVDCIVIAASYSMGFNVLGACDRIYASPAASFLFHPVRATVGQPLRAIDAMQLAQELQKVDNKYLTIARKVTGLDKKVVLKAYYDEKFWSRQEFLDMGAKWFTPIDVVYNLKPSALEYPEKEDFERMRREGTRRGETKLDFTLENSAFVDSLAFKIFIDLLIGVTWFSVIGVIILAVRKLSK